MQEKAIKALKEVYDPELPVNIYDLGLIYEVHWVEKEKSFTVVMTLTTPSCPAAELLPNEAKEALLRIPSVRKVNIELTFDPPYSMERLSEEARLMLGWS